MGMVAAAVVTLNFFLTLFFSEKVFARSLCKLCSSTEICLDEMGRQVVAAAAIVDAKLYNLYKEISPSFYIQSVVLKIDVINHKCTV